jgi:hypothetical protein
MTNPSIAVVGNQNPKASAIPEAHPSACTPDADCNWTQASNGSSPMLGAFHPSGVEKEQNVESELNDTFTYTCGSHSPPLPTSLGSNHWQEASAVAKITVAFFNSM